MILIGRHETADHPMATKTAKQALHSSTRRPKNKSAKNHPKKWSARVTQTSDALDLKKNIFKLPDPKKVAQSLKRSALRSKRRKGTPRQSAMSMLNFYINRAGKNLSATQRKKLGKAKEELKKLFDRSEKS